jgi:Family of unknown function (DUF5677)
VSVPIRDAPFQINDAPVQALLLLTQRTWEEFHSILGGHERIIKNERELLANRMMHISEVMSLGLRINASWGLSHAAMSLLRDRYEQAVRFSWLARQPDSEELKKYMLSFYLKARLLMRGDAARRDYEQSVGTPPPQWVTEALTKEQNDELKKWNSLDLRTMAARRDSLPALTELLVGKETLEDHYDTIYAQFSSVAHFDMYSLELLRLQENGAGHAELGMDEYWPGLLILQNGQFDIIQCFEAANTYFNKDASLLFNGLLLEWYGLVSQMNFPKAPSATSIPVSGTS